MRTPFSYAQIYNSIEKAEKYWKSISAKSPAPETLTEKWLMQKSFFKEVSRRNHVIIFLWNSNANEFVFVCDEKHVLGGYDLSLYTGPNGVDFSISNFHPDYLNSNLVLHQQMGEFIFLQAEGKAKETIASFDSFYKKNDNSYFHVLQQTVCVETDDTGQPALFLSYGHDITSLKKEDTSNLVIKSAERIFHWNYNFDKQQIEEVKPISPQEMKVLELLNQGRDTKKIAAELFISPLTVDTHRRNLLKKTNCVDTTALVTYAKIVGIL
ncbi:MAG TPA: helix-turn-helix transcriptional regulator [Segetibacter sp.]|jgi:DNA-binding CsgD family transcriptional regulator